jgi:hypothetical protein
MLKKIFLFQDPTADKVMNPRLLFRKSSTLSRGRRKTETSKRTFIYFQRKLLKFQFFAFLVGKTIIKLLTIALLLLLF